MNQLIEAGASFAIAAAIIAFALPSFIGFIRQKGLAKALLAIIILSLIGLGIETLLIKVGIPGGKFSYNDTLGYKIIGTTPWAIAFAYVPLLLGAFWLGNRVTKTGARVLLTALFTTGFNVILFSALSRMAILKWENAGPIFGMPIVCLGGWLVSSLLGAWFLSNMWGREDPVKRSLAYSAFAILWFWAGVNLGLQQWILGGIGVAVGLLLFISMRIEKRSER